jgi:hypothetical protein
MQLDLIDEYHLNNLKQQWRNTIEHEGGYCPCCLRWGKVYGRPLNETMARSLIWLCFSEKELDGWTNVAQNAPRWIVRSNQLSTLSWWGLVERLTIEDKNKKTKFTGKWRATHLGFEFIHEQIEIPQKVFTYNDTVEGVSEKTIKISDCFGEIFDYQEIMKTKFVNEKVKK